MTLERKACPDLHDVAVAVAQLPAMDRQQAIYDRCDLEIRQAYGIRHLPDLELPMAHGTPVATSALVHITPHQVVAAVDTRVGIVDGDIEPSGMDGPRIAALYRILGEEADNQRQIREQASQDSASYGRLGLVINRRATWKTIAAALETAAQAGWRAFEIVVDNEDGTLAGLALSVLRPGELAEGATRRLIIVPAPVATAELLVRVIEAARGSACGSDGRGCVVRDIALVLGE